MAYTPVVTDNRRPDIQGLRAFAVFVVVCFHAGLPVPGGFVGVDVFFVISGYVITSMLGREWGRSGRLHFGRFYARRFKRLTPALALMVSTVVVLSVLIQSPLGAQQTTAKTAIGAMLLSANIVIYNTTGGYFDAAAVNNPLLNTWSLSVEEQFYLVFPMVLLVGWWVARRYCRLHMMPILIVTVVALGSFTLMLATSRGDSLSFVPGELVGFYGPFSRAWEFAAGALLALIVVRRTTSGQRSGSRASWVTGVLGVVMLLASLWVINESVPGPGVRNMLPVVGTMLVLFAGAGASNPSSRLLATRPLVALGDVSYSWYLWHWPFIVFAVLLWPDQPLVPVAAAVISLLPSIASYRWVEQPVRLATGISGPRRARILAITLIPPIALSATLLWAAGHGYWSTAVANYQKAHISHADVLTECASALPVLNPGWDRCHWNKSAAGAPIYLLGDSNAGHFSEAVIGAAEKLGRPLTIFTVHGCPFMDVRGFQTETAKPSVPGCAEYVAGALSWLEHQPPGLVILSSSSSPWSPAKYSVLDTEPWSMTIVSADYLESVITTTVKEIKQDGNRVLLLQTAPHFSRDPYFLDYNRCSVWAIMGSGCTQLMPQEFADRQQGDLRSAIKNAAESTGSQVLDFRDVFCPQRVCRTRDEEMVLYSDGGHLSVAASEDLASLFTEAIG